MYFAISVFEVVMSYLSVTMVLYFRLCEYTSWLCLLFAYWVFLHACLSSADFFSKSLFQKKSFSNTIRVSNSLDPEQDRAVGPYLGQTCLQRLSAEEVNVVRFVQWSQRNTWHKVQTMCIYSVDIYCFKYSVDPDRFSTLLVDTGYLLESCRLIR